MSQRCFGVSVAGVCLLVALAGSVGHAEPSLMASGTPSTAEAVALKPLNLPPPSNPEIAPAQAAPACSKWEFQLTPYAWAYSVDGYAYKNGRGSEYDLSQSETLGLVDEAKALAFLDLKARKGKVSFDVDFIYLDFANVTLGDLGASNPLPRSNADLDLDFKQLMVRFGGGYTVYEGLTPFCGRKYAVDLQAGGRYLYLEGNGVLAGERREVGFDGNENFIEPWVGAEARVEVCNRTSLVVGGNVGGFGTRNCPDTNWEVYSNLLIQVTQNMALNLGYRHTDLQYEEGSQSGSRQLGMVLDGPTAGLTFRF